MTSASATGVGPMVKEWRRRRSRSQLDLALEVAVSPRHLSFVETGRSRPSPGLVLAVAHHLDVPLRERNAMLIAAGHAPRFLETDIEHTSLEPIMSPLRQLLDAHDPYPAIVLDRHWDILLANGAAQRLVSLLPAELAGRPTNMFRASLHPDGFAAFTANFDVWGSYLVDQLTRLVRITRDPVLKDIEAEVTAYPNVRHLLDDQRWNAPITEPASPLIPCIIDLGNGSLSMFTTMTTFGTPRDITLDEITIELFYPSDDATRHALEAAADTTESR